MISTVRFLMVRSRILGAGSGLQRRPLLVCGALTGNSRQVEVTLRPGARKRQTGDAPSPADLCEAHLVAAAVKPIVATRPLGWFDKVPGNHANARLGGVAAQGYRRRADDMARPR